MKTKLLISSASLGLAFFVGCTSSDVPSNSPANGPQVATLEAYSIELETGAADDERFGARQQEITREIIENELENLGYVLADAKTAQFKVIFATYTEGQIDGERVTNRASGTILKDGGKEHLPQRRVITTTDNGPIVLGESSRLFLIDVVDTATDDLLWRGYTRSEDPELTISVIQDEVEDILDAFPFAENELSFRLDEFDFMGAGGA